ncbi:hypothetical protein [Streptomyces macrosporus]|uniref:Head-to-tail adaptor n=1 Tax=Streptomyces macrosporus TaxID=44032 RepID=A0ABN3KE33_9ACTN
MGRVYATTAELEAYTGKPAPANAARRLARASRLVDAAMVAAVYEVDADGYPAAPEARSAFREAVCVQVDAWAGREAERAELGPWTSVSAGPVSMSRPDAGARVEDDTALTAEAVEILEALNLPRTVWT